MRLDHTTVVTNLDGESLKDGDGKPHTMRSLSLIALNWTDPEGKEGAEKKAKLFALAVKFTQHRKKVSLTTTESALLVDQAGKALNPVAFGRLSDWVEGRTAVSFDDAEDDEAEDDEVGDVVLGEAPKANGSADPERLVEA